jgi:hypothetical protein
VPFINAIGNTEFPEDVVVSSENFKDKAVKLLL